MKTTTILITSFCAFTINLIGQEFKVRLAHTPQPDYSALIGGNATHTYPSYTTQAIKIESTTQSTTSEVRVIGYYEDGYGDDVSWQKISLKVAITTNSYGKDEMTVTAYKKMNADFWSDVSYGTVSKTYGNMAKEFSCQAFVAGKTVYFTI